MVATIRTASNYMVSLWSAKRISILLTIVALILWSFSVIQAEFSIGFYGFIHSFPISFFIALAFLTIEYLIHVRGLTNVETRVAGGLVGRTRLER